VKEGSLFRSLLKRPIVLAGIAILFVTGLGAGWLVFWGNDDQSTVSEIPAEQSAANRQPGAGDIPASEQGGDTTTGQAGAADGSGTDPADGTPGGQGTNRTAETGPSDQQEAALPPDVGQGPRPPVAADFLLTGFGYDAAPASVAGLARVGEAVVRGDRMTAEYSGGEEGRLDLVFLEIVRTQSAAAAAQEVDALLRTFPANQLSYDWGGRGIRQAMNAEGRPDQFPPLVCFVWTQGQFAIRVVVAPLAPDQVVDARQATLEFVGALPY